MLFSPLEQFQIIKFIPLIIFDISITNFFWVGSLALMGIYLLIFLNKPVKTPIVDVSSLLFVPNAWQKIIEFLCELPAQLISDSISNDNEKYFPVITFLFNFILFSNLIGLTPYAFTMTSHLIITFFLSFSVFIGINIVTVKKYKQQTFSLFLPSNTTFFLAVLLVPIEFISYIAKPISLGVRLFINLMAGHSLLKVIIGFSWGILTLEELSSVALILPMLVLIILFWLELAVALIQTYVFIILTCIYIQDGS